MNLGDGLTINRSSCEDHFHVEFLSVTSSAQYALLIAPTAVLGSRTEGVLSIEGRLVGGLKAVLAVLQRAGCVTAYIDGSFVTERTVPNDFDGCWDPAGVDPKLLDPVLLDFTNGRAAQKAKYRGELFPIVGSSGNTFLDFFQVDKHTGNPKGIIMIDLRRPLK